MVALAPNSSETSPWDVLDTFPKPHSRAREVKTPRCTEAPHSKSRSGIEIWLLIYDDRIGLESFTRDPIGYDGSDWGLYEYITSKPLHSVDPTGKDGWQFCIPGGNPNIRPMPCNPSGPFGPHDPTGPTVEGTCLFIGLGVDLCLCGPSGEGVGISACLLRGVNRCCDALKAGRLIREIERLREQLINILDGIALLEMALASANQQIATLPYGSDEWQNQVDNKNRAQSDIRRLNTTKRRLVNQIIDLWKQLKNCT